MLQRTYIPIHMTCAIMLYTPKIRVHDKLGKQCGLIVRIQMILICAIRACMYKANTIRKFFCGSATLSFKVLISTVAGDNVINMYMPPMSFS